LISVLAQMTWGQWLLAMLLLGVCCLLILVVLLQRGRGGGLTGAFGGAGGTSAFGAKTGDLFTWITVVVATVFVGLSVAANFVFDDSAPSRPAAVSTTAPAAPSPTQPGLPVGGGPVQPISPPVAPADDTGAEPSGAGAEQSGDVEADVGETGAGGDAALDDVGAETGEAPVSAESDEPGIDDEEAGTDTPHETDTP